MIETIARMCCAAVLHCQTQKVVRQGLAHMKYAINHPDEFEMPVYAALIGMMNAKIISILTLCIIFNICHNATISSTLLAFAAYTQCCNVGVWAVNQAPIGNHLK